METNKTILIADDDKDIRGFLHFALNRAGYNILEAEDGAKALALIDQHLPDLAIVDITMPVMDGLELISHLKSRPSTAGVRLLVLSALVDSQQAKIWELVGMENCMVKPVKVREAVNKVDKILGVVRSNN